MLSLWSRGTFFHCFSSFENVNTPREARETEVRERKREGGVVSFVRSFVCLLLVCLLWRGGAGAAGSCTVQTHGRAVTQESNNTRLEIDFERLGCHIINFLIFNLESQTESDTATGSQAGRCTRAPKHSPSKRDKEIEREEEREIERDKREHLLSVYV